MLRINLTQGQFALVDDSDFPLVSKYKWYAKKERNGNFYAARQADKSRKSIAMHRFLMKCSPLMVVDHKNGNGLDNRRNNIRVCTKHQNSLNRAKNIGTTSKYKGVSKKTGYNKWTSELTINKKRVYLGLYLSEVEAAKAYDAAAIIHHGEFARLNFPKPCN